MGSIFCCLRSTHVSCQKDLKNALRGSRTPFRHGRTRCQRKEHQEHPRCSVSMLTLKSSKSSSRNFPVRASKNSSPKVPKSWLPCQQVAEELPLLLPLAVLPLPKKRRRRRKKKNPRNLTMTWDSVSSINSLLNSLY